MSRAGTITARGFTRRNETGGLERDGTRKRERGLATFEKAQRSLSYKFVPLMMHSQVVSYLNRRIGQLCASAHCHMASNRTSMVVLIVLRSDHVAVICTISGLEPKVDFTPS